MPAAWSSARPGHLELGLGLDRVRHLSTIPFFLLLGQLELVQAGPQVLHLPPVCPRGTLGQEPAGDPRPVQPPGGQDDRELLQQARLEVGQTQEVAQPGLGLVQVEEEPAQVARRDLGKKEGSKKENLVNKASTRSARWQGGLPDAITFLTFFFKFLS